MSPINSSHVLEHAPHQFVCEASDLYDLRPTQLGRLETTLGNGLSLVLTRTERDREGDVVAWYYLQELGCVSLTVFND